VSVTAVLVAALFVTLVVLFGSALITAIARRVTIPARDPLEPLVVLALGVVSLGVFGFLTALVPVAARFGTALALLVLGVAGAAAVIRAERDAISRTLRSLGRPMIVWVAGGVVAIGFTLVPTMEPASKFIGTYPFRQWAQYTRLQALAGDYPADNFLPAVVTEYLARGVRFTVERPVMPGQEVSNRPILTSLIVLPFRMVFGRSTPTPAVLPKINDMGVAYPDGSSLLTDFNFDIYLVIATFLNALVLVGAYALLVALRVRRPLLIVLLVCLPSLYVIIQDFYTWPKSAAAFFIVAAFLMLQERRPSWIAGIFLGLGYWFHPYAVIFIISLALYYLADAAIKSRHDAASARTALRSLVGVAVAAFVVIAPWLIWTRFIIAIPGDLITQNMASSQSLLQHVWIRLDNLSMTIFLQAIESSTFDLPSFTRSVAISLASPIGLLFYFLVPAAIVLRFTSAPVMCVAGILLPLLIIQIPFSAPAVPSIMGAQAIWPFMLAIAASVVQDWFTGPAFTGILVGQCALNVLTAGLRIYEVHPTAAAVVTPPAALVSPAANATPAAPLAAYRPHATQTRVATKPVSLLDVPAGWLNAPVQPNLKTDIVMDQTTRPSLFSAAPAKVIYENVLIDAPSRLTVYVGIHPSVYAEQRGADADFEITTVPSGSSASLDRPQTHLTLSPRTIPADRGWHRLSIALPKTGKPIDIVFTCHPGPDNLTYADWCIWGDPVITPVP
jgi:hypothetical protein